MDYMVGCASFICMIRTSSVYCHLGNMPPWIAGLSSEHECITKKTTYFLPSESKYHSAEPQLAVDRSDKTTTCIIHHVSQHPVGVKAPVSLQLFHIFIPYVSGMNIRFGEQPIPLIYNHFVYIPCRYYWQGQNNDRQEGITLGKSWSTYH